MNSIPFEDHIIAFDNMLAHSGVILRGVLRAAKEEHEGSYDTCYNCSSAKARQICPLDDMLEHF
jgi:hypothetical protein